MEVIRKRKRFNVIRAGMELKRVMPELPDDHVYKFVSDGGFSSINFVAYVAEKVHINNFYVSSFRVGKKELKIIDGLFRAGKIDQCNFAVGTLMANDNDIGKHYRYYENFKELCDRNGWRYFVVNNHSKLLLFDTDVGKFVLETSSNLNENPKIEHFSFERDADLYDFYRSVIDGWGNQKNDG